MNVTKLLSLYILVFLIGCKDPKKEVFSNFEDNKGNIGAAVNYYSQIKPNNLALYIKFHSDNEVDFKLDQKSYDDKSTWVNNHIFDQYGRFHQFNVDLDDPKMQEALNVINIKRETLDTLKNRLDSANCNSIGNRFSFLGNDDVSYTYLGYPTHDLYGLYYVIFERELSNNSINEAIGHCNYKKINNSVLVEYGGPAFGSDCFPDKKNNSPLLTMIILYLLLCASISLLRALIFI